MSDQPINANGPAPDTIAADIQALYDQFSQPQKTWFMEQLRRGARGEATFLSDEEQSFEAWLAAPRAAKVEITATVRVPDTFGLEQDIDDARERLSAVGFFVQHACLDRDVGAGIGAIVGDVVDVLRDVSDTLRDMRQEGGAA